MKKTYAESTFYMDLQKLIDKKMDGQLDEVSFDEEYKKLVAQELPHDRWLQGHFNSTAEYMYETLEEDEDLGVNGEGLVRMVETARFEIKVMARCGEWQAKQARHMQTLLDEALAMIHV